MSGAVQSISRVSLTPVRLAGWPTPAWHLAVMGNPSFPCESIPVASGRWGKEQGLPWGGSVLDT